MGEDQMPRKQLFDVHSCHLLLVVQCKWTGRFIDSNGNLIFQSRRYLKEKYQKIDLLSALQYGNVSFLALEVKMKNLKFILFLDFY